MTYYETDSTMWDDEDFVGWDDAARNLWQLLLTGPQRSALPGLQRGGMATLAETLRRPVEAVEAAFAQISGRGKAGFDPIHRVIWVRNAPRYNPAKSPNQIRAWWSRWTEIPDCEFKFKHIEHLRQFARLERETHRQAWDSTFGTVRQPSRSPQAALPEPSGNPPEGTNARACADTALSSQLQQSDTASEAGGGRGGMTSPERSAIEAELRRWPVFADQNFPALAASIDGIRIAAAKRIEWVIEAIAAAGGKIGARVAGGEIISKARIAESVAGYVNRASAQRAGPAGQRKTQPSTGQVFEPAEVLR